MQSTLGRTEGAVSAAHSLHRGQGPSRWFTRVPIPSCQVTSDPQRRERNARFRDPGLGTEGVGTTETERDATSGSAPTKEPAQPRAGTPEGLVPPQGARAREYSFRPSPPPSLPPNQRPLPASLPANPHAPRRIALGGVWESPQSDGRIDQLKSEAGAGGLALALAVATQERGAGSGPGFVRWG